MSAPVTLTISDFTNYRRIDPQDTADLPPRVVGAAIWKRAVASETGKRIPASYTVGVDGQFYPVEFINQQWYFIEWDDSAEYQGYWVQPSKAVTTQGVMSI